MAARGTLIIDTHLNFDTLLLRGGSVNAAGMSLMGAQVWAAKRGRPEQKRPEQELEYGCNPEPRVRAPRTRASDPLRSAAYAPLRDPDRSPDRRCARHSGCPLDRLR